MNALVCERASNPLLQGVCGVTSEIDIGVGWQDPAVIAETGLCVWRSGPLPSLVCVCVCVCVRAVSLCSVCVLAYVSVPSLSLALLEAMRMREREESDEK